MNKELTNLSFEDLMLLLYPLSYFLPVLELSYRLHVLFIYMSSKDKLKNVVTLKPQNST